MNMDSHTHKKERILIVDDTPANIDVLGAILSDEYDISVAVDGVMALDIAISNTPPDLILLDIMMPKMDGYEVAKRLKAIDATRDIPIIFVTAKIEDSDEAFGFEIGAVDYIRKPVNPTVTLARIKSQLELKQYRDRLTQVVEQKTDDVHATLKLLDQHRNRLTLVKEDLIDQKALAQKNQIYFRELFMNSPYGIILVGKDHRIIRTNSSFSKLMGYPISELLNKKYSAFSVDDDSKKIHSELIENAMQGQTLSMEIRCRHKNGYQIPISALAYPVKVNNIVQGVFVFYENISQRKIFEEKLKHQAYHDILTGVPNRLLFSERLDFAIEKQRQSSSYRFSVLLIDLDRFKSVNDSLGHQVGDELLKAVCQRISNCLRSNDTLARLGGDEFAILVPEISDANKISQIAARIKKATETSFTIQDHEVYISASMGIVMDTRSYETANHLLRDADLAMYHAKDAGKAQFKYFTPKLRENLLSMVEMEKDLRQAVDGYQLMLFFQPIVRISDLRTIGFEALVRWNHPEKGIVPPNHFIPIAEETGLILPIGDWIIDTACQYLSKWKTAYTDELSVNINISIKQFLQKQFKKNLIDSIDRHRLSANDIKLEFTESLLMEQTSSAVNKLQRLKDEGLTLSIDDFGTGYSSLSYLQQFPIDQIKIDRSFINSMGRREDSSEIVKSILLLSQSLKLSTVAEGVETEEQFETLKTLCCDYAQGYYFAKPMAPDRVLDFLYEKNAG